MECVQIVPNMKVIKAESELIKGKKYAYASNGYVLGEYYGFKLVSNYCIDKCKCKMDANTLMYEFRKGNRGAEIFEVGLVEIENGSLTETVNGPITK